MRASDYTMARWHPITNLRNRIIQHPPVVVFFMCVLVLAGAFISIGIYLQNHDIKNPDINMDWNQLLGSLARLKFCTQLNDTDLLNETPDMNSLPLLNHGDEPINTQQKTEVISRFLMVPLMHVGEYLDHNSISSKLLGSQLGLKGSAGKQSLNISLLLDVRNHISSPTPKPSNMQTTSQSYYSCLKITASRHILPQTTSPPQCPSTKHPENMSPVKALAIGSNKKSSNVPACISLKFTPDPQLTVLLTEEEKALARYHLLLVSIVLLALCMIMCLFGTLTCSKSRHHLATDPQKETLLE